MSGLLYLLILLACPMGMFFMMRGMGGMGRGQSDTGHPDATEARVTGTLEQDVRIADLERQVAALVEERGAVGAELIGARQVTAHLSQRRS